MINLLTCMQREKNDMYIYTLWLYNLCQHYISEIVSSLHFLINITKGKFFKMEEYCCKIGKHPSGILMIILAHTRSSMICLSLYSKAGNRIGVWRMQEMQQVK